MCQVPNQWIFASIEIYTGDDVKDVFENFNNLVNLKPYKRKYKRKNPRINGRF